MNLKMVDNQKMSQRIMMPSNQNLVKQNENEESKNENKKKDLAIKL